VALEIAGAWPAADSRRRAAVDRDHGGCQSHLGRGTDCRDLTHKHVVRMWRAPKHLHATGCKINDEHHLVF
jgi:hypothetical protein